VVCTIQTFPFALKAVRELAATQGKRFAVIADEAHSSQTAKPPPSCRPCCPPKNCKNSATVGKSARKTFWSLRWPHGLTMRHYVRSVDGDAEDQDDGVVRHSTDPSRPASKDNLPAPFHVYSMRQAIEEKFILDVLQNYTPTSWRSNWLRQLSGMALATGRRSPRHRRLAPCRSPRSPNAKSNAARP